ncbi:hypothetical protein ACET3Z_004699 [Daucus carota]
MPLLRYQKEWLAWALKQEESAARAGILADQMGMGKIAQAIALVMAKKELEGAGDGAFSQTSSSSGLPKVKATLVICPMIAVMQWANEISGFTLAGRKTRGWSFLPTNFISGVAKSEGYPGNMSYDCCDAIAWALQQEESAARGGILADETGMGKTVQAIALVLALPTVNDVLAETAEPPPSLIMPLLRYQKEGLAWALKQEESAARAGILADEMGMGKTAQAIALVMAKKELEGAGDGAFSQTSSSSGLPKVKATLVICPMIAVMQWANEISGFTLAGRKTRAWSFLPTKFISGVAKSEGYPGNMSYDCCDAMGE